MVSCVADLTKYLNHPIASLLMVLLVIIQKMDEDKNIKFLQNERPTVRLIMPVQFKIFLEIQYFTIMIANRFSVVRDQRKGIQRHGRR